MGFFDALKEKANAVASDAGRAGKVTAAQARAVVLQSDVRKAERELGHVAFDLIERGELEPAGMAEVAARLREAHRALTDKDAEIAAIRAEGGDPGVVAHATGESAAAAGPAPADEAARDESAGRDAAEAHAGGAAAEAPAAQKPARRTAPRKPGGKAPTPKPAAKKTGGAGKAGGAGTSAKTTGGSQTTSRPAADKPAGKLASKLASGVGDAVEKPRAGST